MRISGRRFAAVAAAVVFVFTISGPALAKPPADDSGRDGPADGPRGKSQRTPAFDDLGSPPDFWPESARVEVPNKGEIIPGSYIVVFRPGTPGVGNLAHQLTDETGGQLKYI